MKKKRIFKTANAFLFLVLILFSCSKNTSEEVIDNASTHRLATYKLSDFSSLPADEQRALYLTLDETQRYNLWIEKFDVLIASTTDLSEKNYYIYIRNEFNINMFSSSMTSTDFNSKWQPIIDNLKNQYNWTDDDIYVTFATLFEVEVNRMASPVNYLEHKILNDIEVDCNCRWGGLGCAGGDCDEEEECPDKPSDEMGCGFLFMQSCTGQCE